MTAIELRTILLTCAEDDKQVMIVDSEGTAHEIQIHTYENTETKERFIGISKKEE